MSEFQASLSKDKNEQINMAEGPEQTVWIQDHPMAGTYFTGLLISYKCNYHPLQLDSYTCAFKVFNEYEAWVLVS